MNTIFLILFVIFYFCCSVMIICLYYTVWYDIAIVQFVTITT